MDVLAGYRRWKLNRIKEITSVKDVSHGTAKRLHIWVICEQQDVVRLAWRIHRARPDQDLIFLFCYPDAIALAAGMLSARVRIGDAAHRVANGSWGHSFVEEGIVEVVFEGGQ